jgi:hypothetical protein
VKSVWKIIGILKIAIITLAALISLRLKEPYPLAILAAGILAINAAGVSWGIRAGKRVGATKSMSIFMTVLRGSSWWAPILARSGRPGAADDGPGVADDGKGEHLK